MLELFALVVFALLIAKEAEKMGKEGRRQDEKPQLPAKTMPADLQQIVGSLQDAGKTRFTGRERTTYDTKDAAIEDEHTRNVRIWRK